MANLSSLVRSCGRKSASCLYSCQIPIYLIFFLIIINSFNSLLPEYQDEGYLNCMQNCSKNKYNCYTEKRIIDRNTIIYQTGDEFKNDVRFLINVENKSYVYKHNIKLNSTYNYSCDIVNFSFGTQLICKITNRQLLTDYPLSGDYPCYWNGTHIPKLDCRCTTKRELSIVFANLVVCITIFMFSVNAVEKNIKI